MVSLVVIRRYGRRCARRHRVHPRFCCAVVDARCHRRRPRRRSLLPCVRVSGDIGKPLARSHWALEN